MLESRGFRYTTASLWKLRYAKRYARYLPAAAVLLMLFVELGADGLEALYAVRPNHVLVDTPVR
jgi:hypothetical protein